MVLVIYSRLLNLPSWLLSTCRVPNVSFIDDFNLFWNCVCPFFLTKMVFIQTKWALGPCLLICSIWYKLNCVIDCLLLSHTDLNALPLLLWFHSTDLHVAITPPTPSPGSSLWNDHTAVWPLSLSLFSLPTDIINWPHAKKEKRENLKWGNCCKSPSITKILWNYNI